MHKDLRDEGDETPVSVVPPLSDDETEYDPEALDGILHSPASYEQAQVSLQLPVWLRESSSSFHWRWVPLPVRKVARSAAKWVQGPDPPKDLRLKPFFPKIQETPVKLLDKFFPKRGYKLGLLLFLYFSWLLSWSLVLWHSASSGYIEGYGKPVSLWCGSDLW